LIILHLALGGCLKAPPVEFGITADTGGHIAYILDAARHQAMCPGVSQVEIVTRLFVDERLDPVHAAPVEAMAPGIIIRRIATSNRRYLEKEALCDELAAFTEAFCDHLSHAPNRPDVIHAHFADAAAVASEAQRRFGIPFVYTPHALGIDKRAQHLSSAGLEARIIAERAALRDAAAIIVSTRDEAERQIGGYGVDTGGRVQILPPGIPRRDLVPRAPTLADRLGAWFTAPERPLLLAIARPVAKKNLAALIRAYAGNDQLRQRANLLILAGQHDHVSGEEAAILTALQALASTDACRGRVALPPHHDADDVAALYALAARGGVFVNPALHEPFGLTLVEAAAAGVPVVATRNGGPAEIVATIGHGLLVDPRDDAAIGAAIAAIVTDPVRHAALSLAALTGVDAYCWDRYAAASIDLYQSARAPRLLACDIDNTLTGCTRGAAAFARWRAERRLPFVVATGRGFPAARAILRQWGLPTPDAFITDVGTRLILRDTAGRWRPCRDYARHLDRDWDRAAVVSCLGPLALTPQPATTAGPHKISFFGTADDADRARRALDAAGLRARVIYSHGRLIDVLAPHGGKAAAIAAYAARSGMTLAQCVAAGDSGNDADMLTACGHAIVVGNASDELDGLPARPGLHRVSARHAAGVLEGLAAIGLHQLPSSKPIPISIPVAA